MSEEKRRSKRQSHPPTEEGWWDCSMCTYKNPPEFFKCEMCECRKGTSTRKPRVTPQIVAQQVAQSVFTPPPPKKERKERKLDKRERTERQDSTSASSDYAQDDLVEGDREEPEIPDSQPETHIPPPVPAIKTKKEPQQPVVDSHPISLSPQPLTGGYPQTAATKPKKEPSTSKEKPVEKEGQNLVKCTRKRPPRLKNIDRSSGQSMEVTVNNVTVVITDYKPKKEKSSTLQSSSAAASSTMTSSDHNKINSLNHTTTQQALHERDGESKDSFSSNHTDTVFSGGEGESINGEVSSTVAES